MQVLKHWIENSVEDRFAKEAVRILNSSKEEVESMVSSNAFIITEMERRAEEKGMEKGVGKGKAELLLAQLTKRFEKVPNEYKEKIELMSEEKIELIGLGIFEMKDIREIEQYF